MLDKRNQPMIALLPDDILEHISRFMVGPEREVDDLARDAVSVSLTCRGLSALGRALWKRTEEFAGCMDPCPECESFRARCVRSQVVMKSDIADVARSCAMPYASSLPRYIMEDRLKESDEPVGPHCPIARSAALYVLHMKLRRMKADDAIFLYKDRDLTRCRRNNKGYLYSDLRRAPKKGFSGVYLKRQKTIAELDALFGDRKRPWHVRTQYHADALFRREKLLAEGYPRVVSQWYREEDARKYRELCAGLGVNMSYFAYSFGPNWYQLREHVLNGLPELFRNCTDVNLMRVVRGDGHGFYVSNFDMSDVNRVRELCESRAAEIEDVPAEAAKEARTAMTMRPCNTALVVMAVRLHADGLPAVAVHWDNDPDEVRTVAEWARDMRDTFNVKPVAVFETFVAEVLKAVMADVMKPPFENCHVESLLEKRMMSLADIADARRQVADAATAIINADPRAVCLARRMFGLSLAEFVATVA